MSAVYSSAFAAWVVFHVKYPGRVLAHGATKREAERKARQRAARWPGCAS